MTDTDRAVARETFKRLQEEAGKLNFGQQAMLKAAYTGLLTFDKLPETMQMMFTRVGSASAGLVEPEKKVRRVLVNP
jgi:hypothetical protein